jgi:hypothetical protein
MFSFMSLAFTFLLTSTKASDYKIAACIAVVATFLLVWVNGAAGIIGDSDINMLYSLVVLTLFIGTIIARLDPLVMSRTLFAAAFVQFMIPIFALVINTPDFSPGVMQVFLLNGFWVMAYVASGFLFQNVNTGR